MEEEIKINNPNNKDNKKNIIIIVAVAAVLLISIVTFILLNNKKESNTTKEDNDKKLPNGCVVCDSESGVCCPLIDENTIDNSKKDSLTENLFFIFQDTP